MLSPSINPAVSFNKTAVLARGFRMLPQSLKAIRTNRNLPSSLLDNEFEHPRRI